MPACGPMRPVISTVQSKMNGFKIIGPHLASSNQTTPGLHMYNLYHVHMYIYIYHVPKEHCISFFRFYWYSFQNLPTASAFSISGLYTNGFFFHSSISSNINKAHTHIYQFVREIDILTSRKYVSPPSATSFK